MAYRVNSDWLETEVELVKTLHGVKFSGYDDANCTVDFKSKEGDNTVVKVFIDKNGQAGKANLESVRQIISDYEDAECEEIILMAENYTASVVDYVKAQDNFTLLTPNTNMNLGVFELLSAIQNITMKLCKQRCGNAPETEEDCKGYENGELVCPIRCISDNADFHAERGWTRQLRLDFENLVKLEKAN